MSAKTSKRIQLRLRLFKVCGNNGMIFLHRPSSLFEADSMQGSRAFGASRSKQMGENNQ
jgi:hypothetical protein